jgi:hypothetical protein
MIFCRSAFAFKVLHAGCVKSSEHTNVNGLVFVVCSEDFTHPTDSPILKRSRRDILDRDQNIDKPEKEKLNAA